MRPQAWRESTPWLTSAPDVAIRPTTGIPSSVAVSIRRVTVSPSDGPMAPRCSPPPSRNSPTGRPSSSTIWAEAAEDRRAATGTARMPAIPPPARPGRTSGAWVTPVRR